ncbi:MAG: DUF421 domain-containing protein [Christensenellales bacterium]|jgi:uncharacterized membrane protein YcaP (DUF421 family)|nr:DUF421 domain-containing protein [Clostridia bacterium]HRU84865.1 DUF421 domain-containing protein [Eubacteriales bacterium]
MPANFYVNVLLRSLIAIAALFLLAKILGPRQIAQLTFFDYVTGITVGSIAAELCLATDVPAWGHVLALATFTIVAFIISFIERKSILGRRLLEGRPAVIIKDGNILYKGLQRNNLNLADILRDLRTQGYFNISDIQCAVFESNGMLSVLPKAINRPVTPADLKLAPPEAGMVGNVVMDGKILEGNLENYQKDKTWLVNQLKKQGAPALEEVVLATLDDNGNLSVYKKNMEPENRTVFQ